MALPPGLLPESVETRPSRASLVLGTVVCAALVAILALLVQNRKLTRERDEALRRASVPAPKEKPPAATPAAPEPVPPSPPSPASATASPIPPIDLPAPAAPAPRKVRVLPEDPESLARGLQEFRRGAYDQAERQFFRGLPESFLYLSLTSLAQRNWREACSFLGRAMATDPEWLRRVNPRDLFGKEADYDAVLQALDEQVSRNPLDADLKILAAYVRFHDKGAPYARALLVEATTLNPDHEAAKTFLEALGP
jgi:hypothetical protein